MISWTNLKVRTPTNNICLGLLLDLINRACFVGIHVISLGSGKLNLNVTVGWEASWSDLHFNSLSVVTHIYNLFPFFFKLLMNSVDRVLQNDGRSEYGI